MFGNNLFRCVVEDNKDPEHLGRVRLRVLGVHDAKKSEVKTEELPWSDVLQPPGSTNIVGGSVNVPVGTWGYCIPLDESFTSFLMIGAVRGKIPDPSEVGATVDADGNEIGFRGEDEDYPFPVEPDAPCNPLEYQDGDHSKTQYTPVKITDPRVGGPSIIFEEPYPTSNKVVYPHNKVYEDHNQNILEIDGTKGNARIRIQHATRARLDFNVKGDTAIQTGPNGNVWFGTNGLFAIDADGNLIIQGDVKITGNLEVFGDLGITATYGPIIAKSSQIQDFYSTLASLREAYNAHTHEQGPDSGGDSQVETDPPQPDPQLHIQPPFEWVGYPK